MNPLDSSWLYDMAGLHDWTTAVGAHLGMDCQLRIRRRRRLIMTERPKYIKDKHLAYLDTLRETGVTNMWGAQEWLLNAFKSLTPDEGSEILSYWMKTFGEADR